jgi:hypothetical protein
VSVAVVDCTVFHGDAGFVLLHISSTPAALVVPQKLWVVEAYSSLPWKAMTWSSVKLVSSKLIVQGCFQFVDSVDEKGLQRVVDRESARHRGRRGRLQARGAWRPALGHKIDADVVAIPAVAEYQVVAH